MLGNLRSNDRESLNSLHACPRRMALARSASSQASWLHAWLFATCCMPSLACCERLQHAARRLSPQPLHPPHLVPMHFFCPFCLPHAAAVHDRCGVRLHVADRKHGVMQQLDLPGELGCLCGALGIVGPVCGTLAGVHCLHVSLRARGSQAAYLYTPSCTPSCPSRLRPRRAVHHRPLRHTRARVPVGLPGVRVGDGWIAAGLPGWLVL